MSRSVSGFLSPVVCAALLALPAAAQQADVIVFDSERFVKADGSQIVEHLGQKALRGGGSVKDIEFSDGVIEFDVTMDGSRCFPGVLFRMASPTDAENFYLRPHRSGEPTALQYTPVFNGLDAWQLYHGRGFTAAAEIPHDRWVHVKIEVAGSQARAYLDGKDIPALVMSSLKHTSRKGGVALAAPPSGQVHFANLRISSQAPTFPAPPKELELPGLVTTWKLSQSFPISKVDRSRTPEAQKLEGVTWREVEGEASGLVNVSRWVAAPTTAPLVVFARATIHADAGEVRKLSFGYSDEVHILLNGKPLFTGDASFQKRDPMFYGAVGLNDAVYLDLAPGDNDLVFAVAEAYGGWGFVARVEEIGGGRPLPSAGTVQRWSVEEGLRIPESVAWDPANRVFYVSNFVRSTPSGAEGAGFISRITSNGAVDQLTWLKGLASPTGLAVRGNHLLVVVRTGVVDVDTATGEILRSHSIPGAKFLNDIALDRDGIVYVSDSRADVIFRIKGETVEQWLAGPEVSQPNGLLVDDGRLIWGNTGDRCLKAANLKTGEITSLMLMPEGNIDGLAADGRGNFIVTHWEGVVYRVEPGGKAQILLDGREGGINTADVAYLSGDRLLIVPTFMDNRLVAYTLGN